MVTEEQSNPLIGCVDQLITNNGAINVDINHDLCCGLVWILDILSTLYRAGESSKAVIRFIPVYFNALLITCLLDHDVSSGFVKSFVRNHDGSQKKT